MVPLPRTRVLCHSLSLEDAATRHSTAHSLSVEHVAPERIPNHNTRTAEPRTAVLARLAVIDAWCSECPRFAPHRARKARTQGTTAYRFTRPVITGLAPEPERYCERGATQSPTAISARPAGLCSVAGAPCSCGQQMKSTMAKLTTKLEPTKKDRLIRMLKARAGVDVATLSDKLGWQPHTTWAALTGLRKAGHEITVTKPDGGGVSTYRIIDSRSTQPATGVHGAG